MCEATDGNLFSSDQEGQHQAKITFKGGKMKKGPVVLLGIMFVLWLASALFAGIPKVINFQGYLADTEGNPLHGRYSITFSIYDVETGGTPIWSETKEIEVNHGIFNVQLGDNPSNPLNLPFDVPYWLGVQVNNDQEMTPRLKLASSAYSYSAENLLCDNCVTPGMLTFPAGDITAVEAGDGLSGGGESGRVVLRANTNYLQRRVHEACSEGFAIRQINEDGSVECIRIGSEFWDDTDPQTLKLKVNNQVILQLSSTPKSPNIIAGYASNAVEAGVIGATISGGGNSTNTEDQRNKITDNFGTVGGGAKNTAGNGPASLEDAYYATVGGGYNNTASGKYSTVAGGVSNTASGDYATIPGGSLNEASGKYAMAAGNRAKAGQDGCFVWGDSTDADVTCEQADQTVFRSTGGFKIISGFDTSGNDVGVKLDPGAGSWSSLSSRYKKENFKPVDTIALLERLAQIDILTWNYKSQDPSIRHIGPMAEDFNSLLPDLGGEGKQYISSIDADGVALAAIQGLYNLLKEKDKLIQAQQARLAIQESRLEEQQSEIEALKSRLAVLEAMLKSLRPVLSQNLEK